MNKMKVKVISVFMVLILMSGFFIPIIAEGAEKGRKAVDSSPIVDFYYNSVTDGKYLYYSPDWSFGLIKIFCTNLFCQTLVNAFVIFQSLYYSFSMILLLLIKVNVQS